MEEYYGDDERGRDNARLRAIHLALDSAGIGPDVTMELYSMGFRNGVAAGKAKAANSMSLVLLA